MNVHVTDSKRDRGGNSPAKAWLRALDVDLRDSSQPIASITLRKRRVGGTVRLFEQASLEVCKAMIGALNRRERSRPP